VSVVDSQQYLVDTDGDSYPDVIDSFPLSNIYSTDSDTDQLPDEWEVSRIGNLFSSAVADNDNDGISNLSEFISGTDPLITTVTSGFTQADIDSAITGCTNDPSSCGIDVDAVIQGAIASCVSEPISCGISSGIGISTQTLNPGWNLIGGMDATDSTNIQSFIHEQNATSVWGWDGQWKSFIDGVPVFLNTLTSMSAGKGYFVNVPAQ
jgi:hypothetical protein